MSGASTVVTGHLAEQVERAGGRRVRVRRAGPDRPPTVAGRIGRRGPPAPRWSRRYLALAADTVFGRGDVGRFAAAFGEREGAAGAIAVRRHPGKAPIGVADGSSSPGPRRRRRVGPRRRRSGGSGRPYAERLALDDAAVRARPGASKRPSTRGSEVAAVPIGPTRDLTEPLDLLEQNFPYLKAIR